MSNKSTNNLIFTGFFIFALTAMFGSPVIVNAYATVGAYTITDSASSGGVASSPAPSNTSTPAPACSKPNISYISPDTANVNSGAQTITIVGSCFTPSSQARFNSSPRATTFVDSKKLTMKIDATDKKVLGKYLVNVYEPSVNEFSNAAFFTVKKAPVATAKKASTKQVATAVKATDEAKCEPDATLATAGDDKINLSGNALMAFLGSATFMPNTLLGWIFLFIAVLLLIKLWRKLYVTDQERNAPLKHA